MPPRNRSRVSNQSFQIIIEDLHLCSTYLTSTYWKMAKDLKKSLECPICMTDLINPPTDEMPGGFALRICGHSSCLKCYVNQMKESEDGIVFCPICRE